MKTQSLSSVQGQFYFCLERGGTQIPGETTEILQITKPLNYNLGWHLSPVKPGPLTRTLNSLFKYLPLDFYEVGSGNGEIKTPKKKKEKLLQKINSPLTRVYHEKRLGKPFSFTGNSLWTRTNKGRGVGVRTGTVKISSTFSGHPRRPESETDKGRCLNKN